MPFPTGLRPTPRHRLAAAMPFRPSSAQILRLPAYFGVVPQNMNMEGNSTFGDCVTAEQAAMLMANSCNGYTNQAVQLVVPEQTAVAWATKHGVLEGADLEPVIQDMQTDGMTVDSISYTNGPGLAVDYTSQAVLCAAIVQGPVKLGISAGQLQNTQAGNANGWFGAGWKKDDNEDHCVGGWGYGKASDVYTYVLKMPLPATLDPNAFVIVVYTWSTVGVIDWQSFQNTVGEAWIRNPTCPQMVPVVPTPSPTPIPTPGPTPTPVTIPADAGWFSPSTMVAHAPSGWTTGTNAFNQEVIADEGRKVFLFPAGWSFK